MAKILEILETENKRHENGDINTIHLWREGSFYRMYNQSAWLVVAYCYNESMTKEGYKPLLVTRKRIPNTEDTVCFIGFPLKSLQKFIPNATGFLPSDDIHITIPITLPDGVDAKTMSDLYTQWFNLLPISEEKPKKSFEKKEQQILQGGVTKIVMKILQYPIEQHSLIENTEFISRIKQELATIF